MGLVKIRKRLDKTRGEKRYYKYYLDISHSVINDLGWDDLPDVTIHIEKNGFTVIKTPNQ